MKICPICHIAVRSIVSTNEKTIYKCANCGGDVSIVYNFKMEEKEK